MQEPVKDSQPCCMGDSDGKRRHTAVLVRAPDWAIRVVRMQAPEKASHRIGADPDSDYHPPGERGASAEPRRSARARRAAARAGGVSSGSYKVNTVPSGLLTSRLW